MTTLETSATVFATTPGGETCFAPGVWHLPSVSAVAYSTNAPVQLPELRDGAYVVVDQFGKVSTIDGPALNDAWGHGFVLGLLALGLPMILRMLLRMMARKMGVGTIE